MKKKIYIVFTVLAGVIVVAAAGLIILFARLSVPKQYDVPDYAYRDYIDRSASMTFDAGGGAQLYEAEAAALADGAYVDDNSIASGGKYVNGMKRGATVKFAVEFSADCDISVKLSLCYLAENDRDAYSQNLFSLCLNGVDLGVRNIAVPHCAGQYDFRETEFIGLHVKKGGNVFELIASEGGFTVDYAVLTSALPRSSVEQTVGVPARNFYGSDGKQVFECERGERSGAVPVYGEQYSGGFIMRFGGAGDEIALYVRSDCDVSAAATLSIGGYGDARALIAVLDIHVNGKKLARNAALVSNSAEFVEVSVGKIELVEGVNELKFASLGAAFELDRVVLNADITYSPSRDAIRYEAERASLFGDCEIEKSDTASEGGSVAYNYSNSSVLFNFRSQFASSAYLSLGWSYFGEQTRLDEVISVVVNDRVIDLSGVEVFGTGGYENYIVLPIGEIDVAVGDNVIIVQSKSGYYNFDYITLSHARYESGTAHRVYEAEKAALVGGAQEEYSSSASDGKNVGFITEKSGIHFAFVADADDVAVLKLGLSFVGAHDENMGAYLKITVNGTELDLSGVTIKSTGGWYIFAENIVGAVSVRRGINAISIISVGRNYNVDYIALDAPTD